MVQCTLCTRVFNSERASVRYVVVVPDECGNTIPLLQHKAAKHSLSNRHNISISGNVIRSGVTAEPRHLPLPAQSHCGKCDLLFANDDARDNVSSLFGWPRGNRTLRFQLALERCSPSDSKVLLGSNDVRRCSGTALPRVTPPPNMFSLSSRLQR